MCVCVCAGMTRLYACTIATHSEYGMLTNYVTLKQFLQSSNAIVSKYKRNFYFLTFCLTFCAYLPCNFEDSDLIVINHVICRIIENVIINHVGFFFFFFFHPQDVRVVCHEKANWRTNCARESTKRAEHTGRGGASE